MAGPFIGSEAVASGILLRSALRTQYAKLFRDVYVHPDTEITPELRARAGWLWSRRQGIIAGLSASALYGAKWVDTMAPLEIIHTNRNPLSGIRVRGDHVSEDEVGVIEGVPVTTPARTALDLGCWYPTSEAVAAIDSLARATGLNMSDVDLLARRYPGRRGIARSRSIIGLVDAGAQSPKETWLRLLLIQANLPRPQTQIPIRDDSGDVIAYLDMGWPELKVAVEYDGAQHRNDRRQYNWDIRRLEMLERLGWIVIRVVAGDHPMDILRRVRDALARRASR